MGIEANFNMAQVRKKLKEFEERVERYNLASLNQVGLKFVRDARLKTRAEGSFGDQTGNLRSSIGYIIMKDGKIVSDDFKMSVQGTDRATGVSIGFSYARKIGMEYPTGYALIVVAGMEYAAFVENRHGKDVITGSSIKAKQSLQKYFK